MKISKKLILWCAILVILFVQVPHLAKEFSDMSSLGGWMAITHGTLFAIAIDACVLLFAIRGREIYTMIFMIISYVVTLQYYREFLDFEGDPLLAWSTLLIALSGVLAIYFLSKEVNAINNENETEARQAFFKAEKERKDAESNTVEKLLKEREEQVRAELQEQDGIVFTDDEVAVIKALKAGKTYEQIIELMREQDKPISRDRISKIKNKFKSLHEDENTQI
jgi:hypothetical protein